MELSKEQTYQHLLDVSKIEQNRFKVTTKYKWLCLGCLTPIYVRFTTHSLATIFCETCFKLHRNKPTIAQYQYLKLMKDSQLKFIENQIKLGINNDQE